MKLITNRELNDFINNSFPGRKDVDPELVRDVLMISRLYDRNFERRRKARADGNAVKVNRCYDIEKLLNRLSEVMRNAARIRAHS